MDGSAASADALSTSGLISAHGKAMQLDDDDEDDNDYHDNASSADDGD
jgi:hypothetical protein